MAEAVGQISEPQVDPTADGEPTREQHGSASRSIALSSQPSIRQDNPTEPTIPFIISTDPRRPSPSRRPSPLPYPDIGPNDTHIPLRHIFRIDGLAQAIAQCFGTRAPQLSLIQSLVFGISQIVLVSVLLGLASKPGSARPIPGEVEVARKSQWEACQRPLAAWNIVWAVKATICMGMAVWNYSFRTSSREAKIRRAGERRWYTPCAYCLEILGLVWFIVANVLLCTSRGTCRFTSPYIWWLTFEIACWGYLVAVEIIVGALVFGPWTLDDAIKGYIFLWNSSRRPTHQTRQDRSGPDTGPISREWVNRIPLAVYIPAVVQDETKSPLPATNGNDEKHTPSSPGRAWSRFFLFSRRRKVEDDPEAIWQKTEHPFVRLEPNRAMCAICQVDFEPPKRIGVESGSGPEALRLLKCGHVFHLTGEYPEGMR
ncbi:hypothetical protein FRC07_004077 [Ceratobasidium sp. 392]|nr:hypothetical protein FRC07_004077 [Ceratobasidium sp. 392]